MCDVVRPLQEARSLSLASSSAARAPAPIVIAHRGASAFAPEHTFAAYDLALAAGADYIEQDLQLTADGELIVLHDETLDRTTGGVCTGRVIEKNYADVASCDIGSWFNRTFPQRARAEFAMLRIPKLADVLARYAGNARFYIETKNPAEAPGMEERLVTLIEKYGLMPHGGRPSSLWEPAVLPPVILQSFSSGSLRLLRELAPAIPRVQLIESELTEEEIVARLDRIVDHAQAIGPSRTSVHAEVIHGAHSRGLAVHPYTVNEESAMRRLIAAGIDGMFTDDPALLLSLRSDL